MSNDKQKSYKYLKYMRDGSTKEMTAVVRSRTPPKKESKK